MTPRPPLAGAGSLSTDDDAWDRFVADASAPSFLQATAWATAKRPNGWQAGRIVAGSGSQPVAAQILVRRAAPLPLAFGYAARGPLSAGALDPDAIRDFTAAVHRDASRIGAAYIRIDPGVEDPTGELAGALRGSGWRPVPNLLPASTLQLDLVPDEDALWQGIHRKWRQSITKAERQGGRVVEAGVERIGDFHAIHAATMRRVGLGVRSEGSFRTTFQAFAATGHAHLFFAEGPGGEATATLLLLGWGNRVADLYGGTTEAGRDLRANYQIKWEGIRRAKAAGYRWYDLWGLPSDAVNQFKTGWGGQEVHYVGTWDLVLNPVGRAVIEAGIWARGRWFRVRGGGAAELSQFRGI